MLSSGMSCHVALVRTSVLEDISPHNQHEDTQTLIEAIRSSETLVFTRATWCHIPEDSILHSHSRENLKSYESYRYLLKRIWCIQTTELHEEWCLLGCYIVWLF
jgi:hypothetical protein